MSQKVILTCDKCGKEAVKTINDDPFLSFKIEKINTYPSILGQSFRFPSTIDICRECFTKFNEWLKESK